MSLLLWGFEQLCHGNQVVGTVLDLAFDADRLVGVLRRALVVDLGERAFVATDGAGEAVKASGSPVRCLQPGRAGWAWRCPRLRRRRAGPGREGPDPQCGSESVPGQPRGSFQPGAASVNGLSVTQVAFLKYWPSLGENPCPADPVLEGAVDSNLAPPRPGCA